MQFNQYQIESAETERYADNHKLIANTLGLLGEVGELADDVIKLIVEFENTQNLDLAPIKTQLMEAKYELYHCGSLEKSIRKNHKLGSTATERQQKDFAAVDVHPSPDMIQHIESEAGDVLFHLSRLLASINVDIEHCAIKNRLKLRNRLVNNQIVEHPDH